MALSRHRIHIDERVRVGDLDVVGDEAHHAARVKRVAVSEAVELLDGRGGVGVGLVTAVEKVRGEWHVLVRVESVRVEEAKRPRLDVCSALPKGAKLSELIDGLAQVGAAMWRPLETERSARESWRREKLERVAAEASKQCGRAWRMEIGEGVRLEEAVKGVGVVMADASGEMYEARGDEVRLLIGPEGGWTEEEIGLARRSGARVCRFGVHTMRIETAAVVAAGVVMGADSC